MASRRALLFRYPGSLPCGSAPRVATLGSFDGLHIGHRAIMARVVTKAEALGIQAMAISFYPHPSVVLGKAPNLARLMDARLQCEVLGELGIAALTLVHFTKALAALPAREFLERVVVKDLGVRYLVVGADASIGRNREGTPDRIVAQMQALGADGEVLPLIEREGAKVGSRAIRQSIELGEVESATSLLGGPYRISGKVVRGEGRGRTIAIPTANLYTRQLLPAPGVYAGRAVIGEARYPAVANIGWRPTFHGKDKRVEVHLLDFPGNEIYGRRLTFECELRLREERKFSSPDALVQQIGNDIAAARARLAK